MDAVTLTEVCMVWELTNDWLRNTIETEFLPRCISYGIMGLSCAIFFVKNILCGVLNRQWPRVIIYCWISFTFTTGIIVLWILIYKFRLSSWSFVYCLKRFALTIFISVCVMAGVGTQIKGAITFSQQTDTEYFGEADTLQSYFVFVAMNLQLVGIVLAMVYAYIQAPRSDLLLESDTPLSDPGSP